MESLPSLNFMKFQVLFLSDFSLGAIVLVSGREFGGQAALSIVKTLSEVMDAVLLRQQLQVCSYERFQN